MADVHTPEIRSYNMSQIRNKNTKPELIVRKFLFSHGFRYRINDKKLSGKPDIVLPKYKTVIFVHGCFWHGHEGCKYFVIPKTRTEWWLNKITGNKQKDIENFNKLRSFGWKVLTIFECELKTSNLNNTFNSLLSELH
jgi:DNA mismatch endonuclease, patch repair protein